MTAIEVKRFVDDNFSILLISRNHKIKTIYENLNGIINDSFNSNDSVVQSYIDSTYKELNLFLNDIKNPTFKRYGDIENISNTKTVKHIYEKGYQNNEFVVEEKVHGANFSFIVTDTMLECTRRTKNDENEIGVLDEQSKFHDYQIIRDAMADQLNKMFNHIKNVLFPNTHHMRIYGELFGGSYPHPDVPKTTQTKSVQKGVFYSPDIMFYAFDIVVDKVILPKSVIYPLFEKFDIFSSEPLFIGTLDECLGYPNLYQSTIPHRLGLPPIEDNICEGNVIAANIPIFLGNGSRVILKNKNEKFAEKNSERKTNRQPKIKEEIVITEEVQKVVNEICLYVNSNRLRNVISKYDEINDKMFGKLLGGMMEDIIKDFMKDSKDMYMNLDSGGQKTVRKLLGNEIQQLIRPNFINIMDGEY